MEAFAFDTTEQYLLAATGILFIVQALYYLALYNRINLRSRKARREELHFTQELPPLSVIICAHEEVENLRRNLPAILEQDYPQFEVIVINDGEKSESEDYLTQLENRAARYDWLVMTEANCCPQSNQWLRLMARNFTSRTEVVLGYSGYERGRNWLHRRAAFDNLFTAMRYLGFALAGSPYMGIGRNLAYRKSLFFDQKGFSAHRPERLLRPPEPAPRRRRPLRQPSGPPRQHPRGNRSGSRCPYATPAPHQRLARRKDRLCLHRPPLPRRTALDPGIRNFQPPAVPCRMDSDDRLGCPAYPLVGGSSRLPAVRIPFRDAGTCHQHHSQRSGREIPALLTPPHLRHPAAAPISALETLLSFPRQAGVPAEIKKKKYPSFVAHGVGWADTRN